MSGEKKTEQGGRLDINAQSLLGMPVFSLQEAENIGVVKDVVIDPEERCLLALAVDKRGWYHDIHVVPAGKICRIGEDVINIDEKRSVSRAANLPRIVEYLHNPCPLVGGRIISDDGRVLGKVERYFLRIDDGKLSRLEIADGLWGLGSHIFVHSLSIPAQYIMTIGRDAVVVDNACLADLQVEAPLLDFAAAGQRAVDLYQQGRRDAVRVWREVSERWQQRRLERERQNQIDERKVDEIAEQLLSERA